MTGTAPGKAILFGEHAVVYGRPAIAVPIHAVQARATLGAAPEGEPGQIWVEAPEVGFSGWTRLARPGSAAGEADPSPVEGLLLAVRLALDHFGASAAEPLRLQVSSEIPLAAGMGSSAALSVAVLRAVAGYLGQPLPADAASDLAFQAELHYHGTPSGIDNAVVAHGTPIYFRKQHAPAPLAVGRPFTLVLADSGRPSATRSMVAGVRRRWEAERRQFEGLFDEIGSLAVRARAAIEAGRVVELGPLMNENQRVLQEIGVSAGSLEALIASALLAGATGAKLSGAGGGGLVVALTDARDVPAVQAALQRAEAARTIVTVVGE